MERPHGDRGNAVYEPAIDTVFLDEAVLNPERAAGTFASMQLTRPGSRDAATLVYMDFVLLHEMGHRTLHRSGTGVFDLLVESGEVGRRREKEADEFAVRALLRSGFAYPYTEADTKNRFSAAIASNSAKDENPLVAIANMALELGRSLLFSDVSFSAFGGDRDHPSFFDRCLAMTEAARQLARSRGAVTLLSTASTYLKALASGREQLRAEINFGLPLEALRFEHSQMLALA